MGEQKVRFGTSAGDGGGRALILVSRNLTDQVTSPPPASAAHMAVAPYLRANGLECDGLPPLWPDAPPPRWLKNNCPIPPPTGDNR